MLSKKKKKKKSKKKEKIFTSTIISCPDSALNDNLLDCLYQTDMGDINYINHINNYKL